jgi:hypothetical protein
LDNSLASVSDGELQLRLAILRKIEQEEADDERVWRVKEQIATLEAEVLRRGRPPAQVVGLKPLIIQATRGGRNG